MFLDTIYKGFTLQHWKHPCMKQKYTTKASSTDCAQTHTLSFSTGHSFVTAVTSNLDKENWIGMPEIFKMCRIYQDKIRLDKFYFDSVMIHKEHKLWQSHCDII